MRATDALTISGHDAAGNTSGLLSFTFGRGAAGRVLVKAPLLTMGDRGVITSQSSKGSTGDAGTVEVDGGTVTLSGMAQISSATSGAGRGGNVTVRASEALTISGQDAAGERHSGIFSISNGSGAAGRVLVSAPMITMRDGEHISGSTEETSTGDAGTVEVDGGTVTLSGGAQILGETFGAGRGGVVQVMATDTLTLAGTITNQGDPTPHPSGILTNAERKELGAGNAGRVVVQAPRVALTGGAQIASSTLGPGQGGVVQVTATDTLTLAGTSPEGIAVSGIFASAQGKELGAGNAGRVVVEAPRVVLTGGAGISSSTLGPGQGGAVRVTTAEALTLTGLNSGLRTTASESGPGGDLTVEARQVQLTKGAVISAESTGIGNAGSITIMVRDTFLSHHGTVTTEARQATGGNIRVTAASLVRLQDSQITATVRSGVGDGGNVIIDPALIVLQGSQITANAVAGHGGRASLTASQAFLADFNSAVTATSTRGINGEVNIQAPVTSLSGTVAPLPQSFTRAAELLRDRCAARLHEGTVSSSVERGRDGVPASPDGLLPRRLGGTRPARATPSTAGQRRRTMLVAQPGGLQRDATGQLQITHWPTMAASSQVYDVECAPR